ncbi:MAG: DNA repair protein RadC [Alphaproteobacteria bacterium]|nr:DNA repair protein RadC [Alphaproteobacteria bacterium]
MSDTGSEKPHYHGHRERLRRRFLDSGPGALADYELLEMLLFAARPRGDVKPLAKGLLDRFGSFAGTIAASKEDLLAVDGVGESTVVALKTAEAAALRLLKGKVLDRPVIGGWTQLLDLMRAQFAHDPVERLCLLFLDRKNRLMRMDVAATGTVDHAPVYPREIAKRALDLHASAVILVHNHPAGDPVPSRADIEITKDVQKALETVGVVLHDHLIVGGTETASFKNMGLL